MQTLDYDRAPLKARNVNPYLGVTAYYVLGAVIAIGVLFPILVVWKLGGLYGSQHLLGLLLWALCHGMFTIAVLHGRSRSQPVPTRGMSFAAGLVSSVIPYIVVYAMRIADGATIIGWP